MKESRLGRPAEVIKRGVKSPEKIDVKVSFSILMEKAVKENKRIQKSSRAGYINCVHPSLKSSDFCNITWSFRIGLVS